MAAIVITGDIGAGKSTASKLLAEKFSCPLLDADLITASLWQNDSVKAQARSRWSEKIFDSSGNIIKAEISKIIFNDEGEYKFCNALIHPLVLSELKRQAENFEKIILEVPLIFEALIESNPLASKMLRSTPKALSPLTQGRRESPSIHSIPFTLLPPLCKGRWPNEVRSEGLNLKKGEVANASKPEGLIKKNFLIDNPLASKLALSPLTGGAWRSEGLNLPFKIIYITADFEIRARRCQEQRGWSIDELKRREKFLLPSDLKISLSDLVIKNNSGLENLKEQLTFL